MDPFLLTGIDWMKPVPRQYDIGMREYVGDTEASDWSEFKLSQMSSYKIVIR